MRKIFFIPLLVLLIIGCGTNKNNSQNEKEISIESTYENKNAISLQSFESSIEKWNKLKKEHNNSYTYTIGFSSFTGYRNTTVITVKEGEVIERVFYEVHPINEPDQEVTNRPTFKEDKTNLNTHSEGSPAVTIDKLYKDCSEKYLTVDKNANTIIFRVDEIGILSVCGYNPNGCADDCFRGISIGEIKWHD